MDDVICWLTVYSQRALAEQIDRKKDFETFFEEAPALHPNASKINGVICGVRIEEIEDPLMRDIRYLDKLAMHWRRTGSWTRTCERGSAPVMTLLG